MRSTSSRAQNTYLTQDSNNSNSSSQATARSTWSPLLPSRSFQLTAYTSQVRASHLLIKHSGSRRPASWKDNNITRSKAEAIEILKGHQKTLAQSPDLASAFAALARTESDCSSARDGGDLSACHSG